MASSAFAISFEALAMGILIIQCPHCAVEGVGARSIGHHVYQKNDGNRTRADIWSSFAAVCPLCHKPVAVILRPADQNLTADAFDKHCDAFQSSANDSHAFRLAIDRLWPEPPRPAI